MTLIELEKARVELCGKLAEHNKQAEQIAQALRWEIDENQRQKAMLMANLDLSKILHGEHIIGIRGEYRSAGDARATVKDAIEELAVRRGAKLKRQYFGCKNYDGFYYQGSNHEYGYGPRHGGIVFAVELTSAARKMELSDDDLEAAIYLLNALLAETYKPAKRSA